MEKEMTLLLLAVLSVFLVWVTPDFAQHDTAKNDKLSAFDETDKWQYPYQAPEETRQKLLDVLSDFKYPAPVQGLIRRLGQPDRIDDLQKEYKPLSHYEAGFLVRNKDTYSYRCIWFARKQSKSPGLSDSWLAAYVDKDEKTISVIHQNWLKK